MTIGMALFVVAATLVLDIVLENSGHAEVMIMGQALSFDIWGLFALGAATGVVMLAGVHMAAHGLAQDARRRRERRHQLREARPEAGSPPAAAGRRDPVGGATGALTGTPGTKEGRPSPPLHSGDRIVARVGDTQPQRKSYKG